MSPSNRKIVGPVLLALLLLTGACDIGEVGLVEPGSGSGVQRTALEVTVTVAPEDSATARTLGWEDRRIPDATVRVIRLTTDGQVEDPLTAATDSAGTVRIDDLQSGRYQVTVSRDLSAGEVGTVSEVAPALRNIASATRVSIGDGLVQVELEARRNRARGLVISEVSATSPSNGTPGFNGYDPFQYAEIYNNGTQVVYLDGMLLGKGFRFGARDYTARPCLQTRQGANDPDGVWTHHFARFPGSGTEYPIQPGETVVVATDAVDHSQFFSGFIDLSNADFELIGSGDVDNASVPNMIDESFTDPGDHGFEFAVADIPFLAKPVDLDDLPQARVDPPNDRIWVRIPREAVVDVLNKNHDSFTGSPFCANQIHDNFDVEPLLISRSRADHRKSFQRRVHPAPVSGHSLLIDTNVGAADLVYTERTPFEPSDAQ